MAKVFVKLNTANVGKLLRSQEMINALQPYADAALSRLGEGYGSNSYVGKTRVNVEIKAETAKAWRENTKNNTILKALR